MRSALNLALAWPEHDQKTLGDLIEHLDGLSEQDRSRVWSLIDSWAETEADDRAKAELRERISRCVFSTRMLQGDLTVATKKAARGACEKLVSSDPVIRYGWLFANAWVARFDDPTDDDGADGADEWSKHSEQVHGLRNEAMAEIWARHGWEGVVRLLSDGDAADVVGRYLARQAPARSTGVEILRICLASDAVSDEKLDGFMRGFIESLDTAEQTDVLRAAAAGATVGHAARLFRCAPLGDATWRLLDRQPQEVRNGYWHAVSPPRWNRLTEAERAESIDCLLRVKRPRAALHAVGQQVKGVETTILKRLLFNLATVHDEPVGSLPVDRHDLSDALDALDGRAGVTREEMASLEYWFIEALEGEQDGSHGIPNLELVIANDPAFFAKAISLVYERNDDRDQPDVENSERWHVAEDNPWVVLSFDPVILGHRGVVFATTNNIYPACRRAEGRDGFERLFADSVRGRYDQRHDRSGKQADWPTDRQAEVLYPGQVSCKYLQRVDVQWDETVDKIYGILAVLNLDVPVYHAPEVFA